MNEERERERERGRVQEPDPGAMAGVVDNQHDSKLGIPGTTVTTPLHFCQHISYVVLSVLYTQLTFIIVYFDYHAVTYMLFGVTIVRMRMN